MERNLNGNAMDFRIWNEIGRGITLQQMAT